MSNPTQSEPNDPEGGHLDKVTLATVATTAAMGDDITEHHPNEAAHLAECAACTDIYQELIRILVTTQLDGIDSAETPKKRLLILNNGTKPTSTQHIADRFEDYGLEVDTFWAHNNEFPPTLDGYDGIFISGSPHSAYDPIPFILREHTRLQDAAQRNIPMLGVCFGSQILATALCGPDEVSRRETCEVDYKTLTLTDAAQSDTLMAHLEGDLPMFVWHNDEVRATHPDMTILASSDECPNQIWRYKEQSIWGIQGHPELTQKLALKLFEEDEEIFIRDGADLEKLRNSADNTLVAKTLLARFAQICLEEKSVDSASVDSASVDSTH